MKSITVSDVSKRYLIGQNARERSKTLTHSLFQGAKHFCRQVSSSLRGAPLIMGQATDHWAIKDISFSLDAGDRLGIIGRNGAGKSTLLKILSRITPPTCGEIRIQGRVASLLEVGTGFHPELTGRENIFLNGTILGMSRREIRTHFDEIVDFSGVERFLDTPVKRYSSGMYVRLAFAVAAHLRSEILIVDEVLAVGDAEFQKKCLGKMSETSRDGRTVLFVSHNAAAVARLCNKGLYLESGRLVSQGSVEEILRLYRQRGTQSPGMGIHEISEDIERYGSGVVRFTRVGLAAFDKSGAARSSLRWGDDFEVAVWLRTDKAVRPIVAIIIYDDLGHRIIDANTAMLGMKVALRSEATSSLRFRLKDVQLRSGRYHVGLWVGEPNHDMDGILETFSFDVEDGAEFKVAISYPGTYLCNFSVTEAHDES